MVPESRSSHTVRHPSSYLLYLPNPAIDSRLQLIEEQRILSLLTKICNLWFFSTFITLLFVPVVYSLFDQLAAKLGRRKENSRNGLHEVADESI